MKRNDLQERLIQFAVDVTSICEQLPNSYTANYLSNQLTRSAISPALNYGEAQVAESRRDFIHKLKICLKELKETEVSIEVISRKKYSGLSNLEKVKKEVNELISILIKSIQTSRKPTLQKS